MLEGTTNRLRATLALCAIAAVCISGPGCSDAARPPNIIFVLVDDMGWVDSSTYGSQYYRTPNLERLAAGLGGWRGRFGGLATGQGFALGPGYTFRTAGGNLNLTAYYINKRRRAVQRMSSCLR